MKYLFTLICLLSAAFSELPPEAYESMKKSAEDVVKIDVLKVKSKKVSLFSRVRKETVTARVLAVVRSKNGLKAGQKITIIYEHEPLGGRAGPSPVPRLDVGDKCRAWLDLADDGKSFTSAAGGHTFRFEVEERK